MEQLKEKERLTEILLDGKKVSEEDYLATFHEFNGIKYEYVNGRLVSTGVSIGKIVEYGMFLIELFRAYLGHYKKSNGRILTEFIFHIYSNYRRPDILILNDDRCDYTKTADKAHLIIELVSEDNKNRDHKNKKLEYQSKEVPYYFVIDNCKTKSKFYQLNNHKQYEEIPLIDEDIIELSLYQGLRFRLSDLFSGKDIEKLSGDPLYEYSFGYLRNIGQVEGKIKGIKIGEERGIKIGEKKKNIEIAKRMKSMDLNIEQIIELTGLDKKELDSL